MFGTWLRPHASRSKHAPSLPLSFPHSSTLPPSVWRVFSSHPDDVVQLLAGVLEVLADVGGHLLAGVLHGEGEDVLHHRLAPAAPSAGLRVGAITSSHHKPQRQRRRRQQQPRDGSKRGSRSRSRSQRAELSTDTWLLLARTSAGPTRVRVPIFVGHTCFPAEGSDGVGRMVISASKLVTRKAAGIQS